MECIKYKLKRFVSEPLGITGEKNITTSQLINYIVTGDTINTESDIWEHPRTNNFYIAKMKMGYNSNMACVEGDRTKPNKKLTTNI